MRYQIVRSFINVVGNLWMPNTQAAMQYTISASDIKNMTDEDGQITRESVEDWLAGHSGDFSSITDFYADIEYNGVNTIIQWNDEENEFAFNDMMYPIED